MTRSNRKRYTVTVHENALLMLSEHIRFVANVSVQAAYKLTAALQDAIRSLEEMPFRCPRYHTSKTSDRYHQLIAGRYKILFAIDHEDMAVTVEYVLDSRRENDL